jgi:hypothetical protein
MLSLGDDSKGKPRSWRTAVTSRRCPAGNPALSTGKTDYRTTGITGNSPSRAANRVAQIAENAEIPRTHRNATPDWRKDAGWQ